MAAERLHGDVTTVPVLAKGKTDTGRCWVYVRDDIPFGGTAPPAAMLYYSRDRKITHHSATPPHNRAHTYTRIALQRFLNLQGKTIHPTPHIRRTGRQPNANPRRRNNHRRSTVITRHSVTKPTSCPNLD
jgi:hypothetical protein